MREFECVKKGSQNIAEEQMPDLRSQTTELTDGHS